MRQLLLAVAILSSFSLALHAQTLQNAPEIKDFYNDYGGKTAVGITILDGLGVPFRYTFKPHHTIDAGMYLGGILVVQNEEPFILPGFLPGIGYTYSGNRFLKMKKNGKNKVRSHGIAVRGKRLFLDGGNTSYFTTGWVMETFRENRKNRSFIFELGPQFTLSNFDYRGFYYDEFGAGIYLRCHWNFYLR